MGVHAQVPAAKGVLGRIKDALTATMDEADRKLTHSYSITGDAHVLEGNPGVSTSPDFISRTAGVEPFDEIRGAHLNVPIQRLNQNVSGSIFAETWSQTVEKSFVRTKILYDALESQGTLTQTFSAVEDVAEPSDLAEELMQVARLISSRDALKSERDIFFVDIGGFDTHSDGKEVLESKMVEINDALESFVGEMKAQSLWDKVTIATASDFARTLTSNGLGTDHAWGGNVFVAGGSIDGGKILGRYPDDLSENGSLNLGRGRLIPTTPWEGMWYALAKWFGVSEGENGLNYVLPNLAKFDSSQIIDAAVLFEE
jgi:cullin-associated NEDD8-dissociated protein 1